MSKKHRDYTTPSSIGSYFGVGFNEPDDQIKIDLGLEDDNFDDEARARMLLGTKLEDSVIDYFEDIFHIVIDERNDELMEFYDGKIKGKVDGMTVFNGLKTVVEVKVSNAKSYKFTENLGYLMQVQCYMLATDAEQALLCGLYQGKPIYKLIPRDEEMIADIKDMTDFVVDVLVGFDDFINYPKELMEKYSNKTLLEPLEDVDETDIDHFDSLSELKTQKKEIDGTIKRIETRIKEKFETGKWENDYYKVALSSSVRKGGVDLDRLSIEHPEIDYTAYMKPSSSYRTLRITKKKK
jgi:hypothetical protein